MKRALIAGVAALAMVPLTSCGTKSGDGGKSSCPTTLKVGMLRIEDQAAVLLGSKDGIFKRHGITIDPAFQESGSNIVASTVSGEYQIATAAASVQMQAISNGIPIKIIAPSTARAGRATGIVVPAGSHIRTVADLAGKRVGTNALKNITTLGVSASVEQAGGNPNSVKFIEIPLPEQWAAVQQGHIDAMALGEPFVTQALDHGARYLADPYKPFGDNAPISTWFTSSKFISQCSSTVDKFISSVQESNKYARAHPKAVRQILPTYTSLTQHVADQISLKARPSELDTHGLKTELDYMKRFKYISKEPSLREMIYKP